MMRISYASLEYAPIGFEGGFQHTKIALKVGFCASVKPSKEKHNPTEGGFKGSKLSPKTTEI